MAVQLVKNNLLSGKLGIVTGATRGMYRENNDLAFAK